MHDTNLPIDLIRSCRRAVLTLQKKPLPDNGPAGQLFGHLGRHPYRPSYTYYIIKADGCEPPTPHIVEQDPPDIRSDATFRVKERNLDFLLSSIGR